MLLPDVKLDEAVWHAFGLADGEHELRLVVRGEPMMLGYWRNPEATAEAIRDGWMHTGDLAVMDDDG